MYNADVPLHVYIKYNIIVLLCLITVPKNSPRDNIPIDLNLSYKIMNPDSPKNNRDYENIQPSTVDMTPNPAYTIP